MSGGRRLLVVPIAVMATALLVSAATGLARIAAPVRGATHQVSIEDFAFAPASLTVQVGDTVTWTNAGVAPHTATADNGTFDSGNLDNGDTFSVTFTTAGEFTYFCAIHPDMTGTITVRTAVATPSPTSAATVAAPTSAAPVASSASAVPAATTPLHAATASPAPADRSSGALGPLLALAIGLLLAATAGILFLRGRATS